MGNILVTEVQVPPQEKPIVGSLPKPLKPTNIVQGYNRFYHTAALFHVDKIVQHSSKRCYIYTLRTLSEINMIPDLIAMAHDFSLLLDFTMCDEGVQVFVFLPEIPSGVSAEIAPYTRALVYQTVRGQLFKL